MSPTVRLCLALHNHQPVGNFDHIFQQAYYDSYSLFLDVFEPFAELKISLHTSGPLMEWLDREHPDYLDRLAALVKAGRVEILGGPYYEPILTMIPTRDRIGQISLYRRYLEERLGCSVQGMWTPERVWEQSLTRDLAVAGMRYTILDDAHFQAAGVQKEQLTGYFVTEDEGQLLNIFPGSELLRYTIPFREPQETIDYLREMGHKSPGCVLVFGDDGEKFGGWPETRQHVYNDGWLQRFFESLMQHRDWLQTCTLTEAFEQTEPAGTVYLPDGSYREMTEWALPLPQQRTFYRLIREMDAEAQHDPTKQARWQQLRTFLRGGHWRNFKVKYPETNEMYTRMMAVSRRLQDAEANGVDSQTVQAARRELYRGQCNCSYWHGAFGGVYLPHLRNAVYRHLIAADNILDQAVRPREDWLQVFAEDLDFDGHKDVRLENHRLICLIAPHHGGRIYELDVRAICHNLLATLDRQEELYHDNVRRGAGDQAADVANIDGRVVFKQPDLDQRLQYDAYRRKALMDHFFPLDASREQFAAGQLTEMGDFCQQPYDTRLLRNPDRMQVRMTRAGHVGPHTVQITKGVTLEASSQSLELSYLLEGLPAEETLHFGVEFNLAGLPAGAHDRYFFGGDDQPLGHLGSHLDLQEIVTLGLADEWLGIRVSLHSNRPTNFWTRPLETVSQSEGGFELVHQAVSLLPRWYVQGDAEGRWSVTLTWELDTSPAEARRQQPGPEAVAVT